MQNTNYKGTCLKNSPDAATLKSLSLTSDDVDRYAVQAAELLCKSGCSVAQAAAVVRLSTVARMAVDRWFWDYNEYVVCQPAIYYLKDFLSRQRSLQTAYLTAD